jgi:hypothetical protein
MERWNTEIAIGRMVLPHFEPYSGGIKRMLISLHPPTPAEMKPLVRSNTTDAASVDMTLRALLLHRTTEITVISYDN